MWHDTFKNHVIKYYLLKSNLGDDGLNVHKWKYPGLLLVGVGISNLGSWIYFIALNLIVLEMTGSPFAVSVLYILLPISAFVTSLWSGSFIDRVNKRNLMLVLDLSRALLVFLLAFTDSLLVIYAFVFFLNIANTMFESSSMIYMTKLVPEGSRQKFNALKNFIQSCGFILGPSVAGLLFIVGSPTSAIQLNALALIISATILFLLPDLEEKVTSIEREKLTIHLILKDWKEIYRFTHSNKYITLIYSLYCLMIVFMSSLDSLEASFATQVLNFSESTYGFLVSIAGGGIVLGSILNVVFDKKLSLRFLICFGGFFTPLGYLIFSLSQSFTMASLGFFLLTFSLSFANTGFMSFYQTNVPTEIMGRFSAVLHAAQSVLIITLTFIMGSAAEFLSIRDTYSIFSTLFFTFGFLIGYIVLKKDKKPYYASTERIELTKVS